MFQEFPYTNFHELNLDWIVKIAKDFLDQYTHIQEVIQTGLEDLTESRETGLAELDQKRLDSLAELNQKTLEGLADLQEKYDTLDGLLQAWYDTHSADIAGQLADAISDFNATATTKSQELLDSWPDDYSELVTGYNYLKTASMSSLIIDSTYNPTVTKAQYISDIGKTASNSRCARTGLSEGSHYRRIINMTNSDYLVKLSCYGANGSLSDGTDFISETAYVADSVVIPSNAKKIGLSFKRVDNAEIYDSDVTAIRNALVCYVGTDKSLTIEGIPADAKAVYDNLELKADFTYAENIKEKTDTLCYKDEELNPTVVKGQYITDAGRTASLAKTARTYLMQGSKYHKYVKLNSANYVFKISYFTDEGNLSTGAGFISETAYKSGTWEIIQEARKIGLSFKRTDDATISDADVTAITQAIECYNLTDHSLTMEGTPADSKTVGDAIERDYVPVLLNFDSGYAVRTNYNAGTILSDITPSSNTELSCAVFDVEKGDKFYLRGRGASTYRLWCLVDENLVILSVAGDSAETSGMFIEPTTKGKLIINVRTANGFFMSKRKILNQQEYQIIMNGGKKYQALAQDIPKVYTPTEGSWAGMDDPTGNLYYDNPTVAEVYSLYDALVSAYPNYVTKNDLGTDQSGSYHIYEYVFKPETVPMEYTPKIPMANLPKILLAGGIHGDGTSGDASIMIGTLYYFLKDLCDNWEENDALTYLRNGVIFKVIPLQNPWGYQNKSRKNSRGVDINRNFPVGWIRASDPASASYGGASAASEAETIIIKNWMDNNKDAIASLDIHANGSVAAPARIMFIAIEEWSPMLYFARTILPIMSSIWRKTGASGLSSTNIYGYIGNDFTAGGIQKTYANACGIPSATLEGAKNYTGSGFDDYSGEMIGMLLTYLGTSVLEITKMFTERYYLGGIRNISVVNS